MPGTNPPCGVCDGGPALEGVHVVCVCVEEKDLKVAVNIDAWRGFVLQPRRRSFHFTPFIDGAAAPAISCELQTPRSCAANQPRRSYVAAALLMEAWQRPVLHCRDRLSVPMEAA